MYVSLKHEDGENLRNTAKALRKTIKKKKIIVTFLLGFFYQQLFVLP